jgi:hypothetical protein
MPLLYKAFAAEKLDDKGQTLLPGCPGMKKLNPGDKVELRLADGSAVETSVVTTRILSLDDSAASRLRAKPGFYSAVVVPSDVDVRGVALGVEVHTA